MCKINMVTNHENIRVKGHKGTWYIIDHAIRTEIATGKRDDIYLLEHETYGDETACVIVDSEANLIMEDVWNGFEDYEENLIDLNGNSDTYTLVYEGKE